MQLKLKGVSISIQNLVIRADEAELELTGQLKEITSEVPKRKYKKRNLAPEIEQSEPNDEKIYSSRKSRGPQPKEHKEKIKEALKKYWADKKKDKVNDEDKLTRIICHGCNGTINHIDKAKMHEGEYYHSICYPARNKKYSEDVKPLSMRGEKKRYDSLDNDELERQAKDKMRFGGVD